MSSKQKQQSSVWSEVLSMEAVFGQPPILPGEDVSAYQAMLRQVIADVRPSDILEKMFVRDIVDLTWEILRWRRIKKTFVAMGCGATIMNFSRSSYV